MIPTEYFSQAVRPRLRPWRWPYFFHCSVSTWYGVAVPVAVCKYPCERSVRTTVRDGIDRGVSVLVQGLLELHVHGRM